MAKSKKEFKGTRVHTRYRLSDGTIVPGATTVLGMLAKPALMHWSWQLGLEGLDYRKHRDKAADIGTLAHYLIQCDITGEEPDLTAYSPEMVDKAENCLISWYEWRKSHKIIDAISEKQMVSEKYGYGGTADCICYLNGIPTLLDFKTGKGIYPSMLVQLAAYRQLVIENDMWCGQAIILNIGRDENESFNTQTVTVGEMDELFNEIFLPALRIYRANKKWKVV